MQKNTMIDLGGPRTSKTEYRMKQPNSNIATLREAKVRDLGNSITNDLIQIQIRHFHCATYTYSDKWRINNSQFS